MFPRIRGVSPKMDGENNGNPILLMDDLGGKPTIFFGNKPYGDYDKPLVRIPNYEPASIKDPFFGSN